MGKSTTTTTVAKSTKKDATALKRPAGAKKRKPITRVTRIKDAPVGTRDAWCLFLKDRSADAEYKGMASPDRMRAISVIWKKEKEGDAVKTKYRRLAAEDKVRHRKEMDALSDEQREELTKNNKARRKAKKAKRKRDHEDLGVGEPPKNPPSMYLRFSAECHAKNSLRPKEKPVDGVLPEGSRVPFGDMAGLISKEWKATDEATKAPYKKAYEAALITHATDLAAWKKKYTVAKAAVHKSRQEEMLRGHEKAVQAMATD